MATAEEIRSHLERLRQDPEDLAALDALYAMFPPDRPVEAPGATNGIGADLLGGLEEALRRARTRGDVERAAAAIEVYAALLYEPREKIQHYRVLCQLYQDELMDERAAEAALRRILSIDPNDAEAGGELQVILDTRQNWRKLAEKLVREAEAARSRDLATQFFERTAAIYHANAPGSEEVEKYLKKSLEVDPRNRRASAFLRRLFSKGGRWNDLAAHLEDLSAQARSREERIRMLLELGEVLRERVKDEVRAVDTHQKVLALDPANAVAMSHLADVYQKREDWPALIQLYENALRARPRGEAEMAILLQIGILWWRKVAEPARAEEYFKRLRKIDANHPAMLEFSRVFYASTGDYRELINVLTSAQRLAKDDDERIALAREIAEISAGPGEAPERAIESWKGILRQRPGHEEAREQLRKLYRSTHKWNALLEMLKEEQGRLQEGDVASKVALLSEMVAIYRDELKLDVMVINTYHSILAIDPANEGALTALAERYEVMGRFSDLIAVLTKRADAAKSPAAAVPHLRRIAQIWQERFNNHNQAIRPLERILELRPGDEQARDELREIYRSRRDWKGLLGVMRREADSARSSGERVAILAEAAEIAADKMDRPRESIQLWNDVLQLDEREPRALVALAELYGKEHRWPALAEIYTRLAEGATDLEEKVGHLRNLAEVYGSHMSVPDKALATWRAILEIDPDDGQARQSLQEALIARGDWPTLESMFSAAGAWEEYGQVLHAAAERAPDVDQKVVLFARLADLQENRLGDPTAAARTRERVLSVDPQNRAAAEALIPYYRNEARWQKLVDVLQVLLTTEGDGQAQRFLIAEICRISEKELDDPGRAFVWHTRAFRAALGSASVDDARRELVRLATKSDSWEELAHVLGEALGELQPGEARTGVLRTLAEVELRRIGRWEEARTHWEELAAGAPEDPEILAALSDVYAQSNEVEKLVAVWRTRVRLTSDREERRALLQKLAEAQEELLDKPEDAAATLRQILTEAPGDGAALKALERIQRRLGKWEDLYGVALARLPQIAAGDQQGRAAHLAMLGGLARERGLGEKGAALLHFRDALALDAQNADAVTGLAAFLDDPAQRSAAAAVLAPIYEARGAWAELARTQEVQLADAAARGTPPGTVAALHATLGALYEERLGQPGKALEAFRQAFLLGVDGAPGNADLEARLARLSFAAGGVEELALTYEQAFEEARTPARKAVLAAALAALYEDSLERTDDARKAWANALEHDPDHARAAVALERLYTGAQDWPRLLSLRRGLSERATDPARRLELLKANAALYDEVLDNPEAAAEAYQEIFELAPDDPATARALERLLGRSGGWKELVGLLEKRAERAATDTERAEVEARLGQIYETELHDQARATEHYLAAHNSGPGLAEVIAALERLLVGAPGEGGRIAEALEPYYVEQGLHEKLVRALEVRLEQSPPGEERRDLAGRVAELREELLSDLAGALQAWRRALRESPAWEHAHDEVIRLGERTEDWRAVVESFEEVLARPAHEVDAALRAELSGHAARIYETKLGDRVKAAQHYRRLLAADSENDEAVEALERVYVAAEDWRSLVEVLTMRASAATDAGERRSIWLRVGQIHEELTQDAGAAIRAYEAIAEDDPADQEALRALEHLYRTEAKHAELVATLRRRVAAGPPPGSDDEPADHRVSLTREMAQVREKKLGDVEGAAEAYHQILDERPTDVEASAALHRIYSAASRWDDLLKLLERAEDAATDDERRADVLYQQGELLRGRLARASAAVESYTRALEADVRHGGAAAALMEMARQPASGLAATEAILPTLRQLGDAERLVEVLELRGEWLAGDAAQRAETMAEAARVAEEALGDRARAFRALGAAFRAEPTQSGLVDDLERLGEALGQQRVLAGLYREVVDVVPDAELQLRLYVRLGSLARTLLSDAALAEESFRRALELNGQSEEALEALEMMYQAGGRWPELCDVLRRRADYAMDEEVRGAYLRRRAEVMDARLGDATGAIEALSAVLDITPDDAEALTALERLYRTASRWEDLKGILARQLEVATESADRVAAHCRMAELCEKHLQDPAEAMEHWTAAVEEDRRCEPALAALQRALMDTSAASQQRLAAADVLEPIAAARQDSPGLVQIAEIRLAASDDTEERRALLERIYALHEEALDDLPAAFRAVERLFELDPEDAETRGRLFRLAALLDRWGDLARIVAGWVDREIGGSTTATAVANALGFVYERHLRDPERACRYYRHVLDDEQYGADAMAALERLYVEGLAWDDLLSLYRDRADAALEPERRLELLGKIARIQEDVRKDAAGAIEAWSAIREIDDTDADARQALERLLRSEGRWGELVEHYQRELALAADDAAGDSTRLALAEVYESRTGDAAAAIDLLDDVLQRDAGNAPAVAALERMLGIPEHKPRLVEMLEPIYESSGAWRKLVGILEAKLEQVEDPTERVDILTRIASLLEDHQAPADDIFSAYARAFEARYGDEELLAALERSAATRGRFDDLVEVYEAGIDNVFDMDLKVQMLLRIAQLQEKELRVPAEAIRRLRQVLEIQEDHAEALDTLERLYGASNENARLVEVIERKAQGSLDDAARVTLLARAAELRERLGQNDLAIAALRQVVDVDPHHTAVSSLERLLAHERLWSDLVAHLRAQTEATEDAGARRVLRHKAARVLEMEIKDVREAIAELSAALDENPADVAALDALERLFRGERMWPDLLEVLGRRADAADDRPSRHRTLAAMADVQAGELSDFESAIDVYRRILEEDGRHGAALAALERIAQRPEYRRAASAVLAPRLEEGAQWKRLVDVMVLDLEVAEDVEERLRLLDRIGEVREAALADPSGAFEAYAEAVATRPDAREWELLARAERLARELGRFRELCDRFERGIAELPEPDVERTARVRLARLYEDETGDRDRAIEQLRLVLDATSDVGPILETLDRLCVATARWTDLGEILERRIEVSGAMEVAVELRMRLAELCRTKFNEAERAVTLYAEVLASSPAHEGAVAALEELAELVTLREMVGGILEPVYESVGDAGRLAWLRELQLQMAATPGERVKLLTDLANLHETRLGSPGAALVALVRAFREDPEALDVLDELERLASAIGAYADIAAAGEEVVGSTELPRDTRSQLHLRVAAWYGPAGNPQKAEAHYQAVLELDPESLVAIDALIELYGSDAGRAADLVGMLERRAGLELDLEAQKRLLFRGADVAEKQMGDAMRAAALCRAVRVLDESDARALGELVRLGEAAGRWDEVQDSLRRLADLAGAPADAGQLRFRLGIVLWKKLGRLDEAAGALREVLDADGGNAEALDALEALFAGADRWMDLQETLARRLENAGAAGDLHAQVATRLRLAALMEQRFSDPDGAIDHLREAAALDPNGDAPWDELSRILDGLGRWSDVVELYQQRSSLAGTDLEMAQQLRMRAAEVLETKLNDAEAALAAWRSVVDGEPRQHRALGAIARIHESLGSWTEASAALEQSAAAAPTDREAADTYCRLARLRVQRLADRDAAEAAYLLALGRERHHETALAELSAMYVARNEWSGVAQLKAIGLETTQDVPAQVKGYGEIAAIYWDKLGDAAKSAEYLEAAAGLAPNDAALGLLVAERLLAAGRLDDAEARYTELLRVAQGGRKNKDAAAYLHMLGRIAEGRGDVPAALAKLHEAYKLDPTNAGLLSDLGRLQMTVSDWDGSLKTYRALLLHKLPPGCGVTKGEVYYRLGLVRLELNEASKALNMFERGLESEPTHTEMKKQYDVLKAKGVK